MIKALIIDDEPLARLVVKEYLQAFPGITVALECNDGFEGVKAIMQLQPELVFLDIQMPKITGFEMLELVEQPPAVIFTTAFDEFAVKAFEAHAIDYLLKPFSKERFDKAVHKFLDTSSQAEQKTRMSQLLESGSPLPAHQERIVVRTGGKIKILPVHEIRYLEAADDYVKIITHEGSFLKNRTMGFFERSLPEGVFVRTHRSFMVNIQHITRIEPYEKENYLVILRCGSQVPVSKSGYAKLKSVLGL